MSRSYSLHLIIRARLVNVSHIRINLLTKSLAILKRRRSKSKRRSVYSKVVSTSVYESNNGARHSILCKKKEEQHSVTRRHCADVLISLPRRVPLPKQPRHHTPSSIPAPFSYFPNPPSSPLNPHFLPFPTSQGLQNNTPTSPPVSLASHLHSKHLSLALTSVFHPAQHTAEERHHPHSNSIRRRDM